MTGIEESIAAFIAVEATTDAFVALDIYAATLAVLQVAVTVGVTYASEPRQGVPA